MSCLAQKTVLAIDDAVPIRTFLRISLTDSGAEFYEAGSAAEGLKLCRSMMPDVVVLDLGLPDKDGLDLLPDIKTADGQAPLVVVLTVRDDRKTRETAAERGADAYLSKPFEMDELVDVIETLLAGPFPPSL